ncbi:carboxymuconolactone decarboxylase family protein [Pantoea agglomerans]|uniref:carboxymuconolactone decarboxylase family protein n=1 Tax=Enterobacter agglomerans TaxID=549 RepID=UPI0012FBF3D2|nr:carboxymuconolactone decarboxylase family protein [Pantoea agglomerans]MVT81337.1 carboxymuconolactone decarboxylase family protein [Pantoea agglomerans]
MKKSLDRETLAQRAPKLAELTQQVMFGDIWQRELLSTRERSLLTLATLTALGRVQQLPWHIDYARQNGLTQDELVESFTHLAFYAGWPAAVTALGYLEDNH